MGTRATAKEQVIKAKKKLNNSFPMLGFSVWSTTQFKPRLYDLHHGPEGGTFYTAQNWLNLETTFPRKHEALKKGIKKP